MIVSAAKAEEIARCGNNRCDCPVYDGNGDFNKITIAADDFATRYRCRACGRVWIELEHSIYRGDYP